MNFRSQFTPHTLCFLFFDKLLISISPNHSLRSMIVLSVILLQKRKSFDMQHIVELNVAVTFDQLDSRSLIILIIIF